MRPGDGVSVEDRGDFCSGYGKQLDDNCPRLSGGERNGRRRMLVYVNSYRRSVPQVTNRIFDGRAGFGNLGERPADDASAGAA
jgi:hypothetical protein